MVTAPNLNTLAPKPITLAQLTPTQFENLVFDLISAMGLRNVAWRTPGADGGRDIEAEKIEPDFAGVYVTEKWFIECKRYTGSVDWPTIYKKIAYADSQHADYLLMCTPSKYTPAAITQAENWNTSRRTLKVRLWPGHELERQLKRFPDIENKYGLSLLPDTPGRSVVALALALSKTIASHHSMVVFAEQTPDRMLLAAQSLADLLLQRMEDVKRMARIKPIFGALRSEPRWTVMGKQFKIDLVALTAFLSYLHALTNNALIVNGESDYICKIPIDAAGEAVLERYRDVFLSIALWGDFEYVQSGKNLQISQRVL